MAVSLYEASVERYLQGLAGASGFLEKARQHCASSGIELSEMVEARLHPDMLPLRFQLVSVAHHSLGALRGVEAGVFEPPRMGELDFDALLEGVQDAREQLAKVTREEVEALEGRDLVFKLGESRIPFTAEGFLLSFSLPNFYFHTTTAYDILRMKGVPLGKRDFTGPLRLKT